MNEPINRIFSIHKDQKRLVIITDPLRKRTCLGVFDKYPLDIEPSFCSYWVDDFFNPTAPVHNL